MQSPILSTGRVSQVSYMRMPVAPFAGLASAVLLMLVLSSQRSDATTYLGPNPQPRRQTVRIGGGRQLELIRCGIPGGPLVLYFHGTPGSAGEACLIHAEAVAAGVELVGVSRPGMGRSTYQSNRRITCWPSDVGRLLRCLGTEHHPIGIVALSGGAPYALACARQIPQHVHHIAMVSGHTPPDACGVCPGSEDKKIALVTKLPRVASGALTLVSRRLCRKPQDVVEMVTGSWTAADRRLVLCDPWLRQEFVGNLRSALRCGPDGVVTDIGLLGSCWGFAIRSAGGCVPTSIWSGTCDRIAPTSMARYMHRQLPGSSLHVTAGGGHVTTLKANAMSILALTTGDSPGHGTATE